MKRVLAVALARLQGQQGAEVVDDAVSRRLRDSEQRSQLA